MLLAIDVGNTHTKFGVYEGETLLGTWRASTDHERTPDEWAVHLDRFLALGELRMAQMHGCIVASVVPPLTDALRAMAQKYFGFAPLFVSGTMPLGIAVDYPQPDQIGADRLVGAVAAVAAHGAPVIVVDFGTSTNFDVVDAAGAYIGGVIATGLESSLAALTRRAARLFKVELDFPPAAIGRSTTEAMQSGLMWGYVSLIEGLTTRIQHQLGQNCPVIATGGLADRLAPQIALITAVDPDLTIKGLRLVWERNQPLATVER